MPIVSFPPIDQADENGLLAIGGDLQVESLLLAYKRGIFPWPINEDFPLAWFAPNPRGIIEFTDFHIPKSLKKTLKKNAYKIKFNTNFEAVIMNCALISNRKGQTETWITQDIINAYIELFRQGYAYSVEVYTNDDEEKIVGGVYGVCIDSYFSGESMFYRESDASKIALVYLVEKLESIGVKWLDTQMVTSVVSNLGGKEISREEFMAKLKLSDFSTPLKKRKF
jgi:leucyl/phenylalanyl-tRNA--protein transferase